MNIHNMTKAERNRLAQRGDIKPVQRKTAQEKYDITTKGDDGHGEIRKGTVPVDSSRNTSYKNHAGRAARLNAIIDDKSIPLDVRRDAQKARRKQAERETQMNGASREEFRNIKPKSNTTGDNWRFNKKGEVNNFARGVSKKRHRLATSKA